MSANSADMKGPKMHAHTHFLRLLHEQLHDKAEQEAKTVFSKS